MEGLVAKLREIDKTVPYVNHGGCAILAHAAYQYVKHNHPRMKNYEIVYLVRSWDEEGELDIKSNKPVACAHAVLRIGNKYYDSDETVTKRYLEKKNMVLIPVSEDLVLKSLKFGSWNKTFNREDYVPRIVEVLGLPTTLEEKYAWNT